jgi:hypothetical protein
MRLNIIVLSGVACLGTSVDKLDTSFSHIGEAGTYGDIDRQ